MFNISTKRADTAIMGNSMGGYGALKIALSHPEQYAFCGAFASSCLYLAQYFEQMRNSLDRSVFIEQCGKQLIDDFVTIWGEALLLKPEDDIIDLVDKIKEAKQIPKLFLTCGTEDCFYSDHQNFIAELKNKSIDYQFNDWSENHTFAFFNQSLKQALDYLDW